MIGNDGFIKIIDFGEAKIVDVNDNASAYTVSVNE